MVRGLIVELDSLVDLGSLAAARRRADWGAVGSGAGQAEAWPSGLAPAELITWARELGVAVGVLTDLPRPAAALLAERFELCPDALIAASAGQEPPPRPGSVLAACAAIGAAPVDALLLGCKPAHHIAAAQAGAVSVGAGWAAPAAPDQFPDVWASSAEEALEALGATARMKPLGESLLDGLEPLLHRGSLIELPAGGRACGRYCSASDRRLAGHRLSELVIGAKEDPRAAAELGQVLAAGAKAAAPRGVGLVASVPVGSAGGFDRFAAGRAAVAEAIGAEALGLLEMTRAVENYTGLDRDARRMANIGRFRARCELGGERVLLIDDIYTSGSQSRACARELLAAGAGEVTALVAAVSQRPVQRECPRCGAGVMRRVQGRRGPLYACTNFHCKHTERWDGPSRNGR